jgi:hypothetical protein
LAGEGFVVVEVVAEEEEDFPLLDEESFALALLSTGMAVL